jgi:predicted transposase/invertase (TIGR01784 family)
LRIFFVELQKFHPKHIDRKNMLDVWMAFLKNPLNDDIQDVPEVKEALDTLKEISADKDEREIYYLRQHTEFGYISEKNVAIQKEREKAEKEKKELVEKAKAEKIESAKKMLSKGLSIEDISDFTGLSLEEVKKLYHQSLLL